MDGHESEEPDCAPDPPLPEPLPPVPLPLPPLPVVTVTVIMAVALCVTNRLESDAPVRSSDGLPRKSGSLVQADRSSIPIAAIVFANTLDLKVDEEITVVIAVLEAGLLIFVSELCVLTV